MCLRHDVDKPSYYLFIASLEDQGAQQAITQGWTVEPEFASGLQLLLGRWPVTQQ